MKELTNDYIETELKKIFSSAQGGSFDELLNRGFVFPSADLHHKDGLLFVGINPSYDKTETKTYTNYNFKKTHKKRSHFEHFRKAAEEAGFSDNWSCIDIFYFRETKQKEVNSLLMTKQGLSFLYEQLMLTKKILEAITPKIIVVSNRAARVFFGIDAYEGEKIWMGYNFGAEKKYYAANGTYCHSVSTSKGICKNEIPVIFSRSFLYMKKDIRAELIETIKSSI